MMIIRCLVLIYIVSISSFALGKSAQEVTDGIVKSANGVLGMLDKEQLEKVKFGFDDDVQRKLWSNLPSSMVPRKGLRMGDLSNEQKAAVMGVLKATLSERGYQQVVDNMYSERLLRIKHGVKNRHYSEDEYYFSILGEPSGTEPWMWQYGGHHLAINATVVGEMVTLSPSFTGGNPVDFVRNGEKVRQLAGDEDVSYALAASLSDEQREKAIILGKRGNVAFGPKAKDLTPKKEGILASELDEKQRGLLLKLIEERVGILNDVHSWVAMKKVAEQLGETYFVWFGDTEPGCTSNYRIQGPGVIIEYFAQGKGQGGHMHTHAMYRDPSNDYGRGK
ncbi:MAG: DUF3500 domain-containing protein [Akkermansiaceae bacterium]